MLPRSISTPAASSWAGTRAFTEPWVPTGMKAGVDTRPWAVLSVPALAAPSVLSIAKNGLWVKSTLVLAAATRGHVPGPPYTRWSVAPV